MSSDFTTGKNKKIGKDDLYLMVSDVMSDILDINRDTIYKFYSSRGECPGKGQWGYFDRYVKLYNSNNYTNNRLDDLIVLSAAMNNPEFLDRSDSTINSRKFNLLSLCSSFIKEGKCNDFKLSGFIPHLDRPNEIDSFQLKIGEVPCIEKGYETLTPYITYTDSCGCNYIEPVPQFPLDYPSDQLFRKLASDDQYKADTANFKWEIVSNKEQVKISPSTTSMKEDHLDIATLSTAVLDITDVEIEVTYSE